MNQPGEPTDPTDPTGATGSTGSTGAGDLANAADDVLLDEVPALGPLFLRGVTRAARLAGERRRGTAPTTLPGVTYAVRGVPVDATRLRDYQALLGLRAADRLPAGFVHVMAFPVATALLVRTDFPLPLPGLVHVANRVTQHRPLFRDDHLDVRAQATNLRPHRSGTQLDVVVEVRRAGSSELAWHGLSTYLAKGRTLSPTTAVGGATEVVGAAAEQVAARATTSSDVAEGTGGEAAREEFLAPMPTGAWRLPADIGRRYAAVSHDRNPIHLTALTARPFGFRRAIAHGMYTAARALADVGPAAGHTFTWTVDFASPVYLPATVNVRVAPQGDGFGYAVWNPSTGKPHLTGAVNPLP